MISHRQHVWIVILILSVLGGVFTLYQIEVLGIPMSPSDTEEVWVIDTHLTFEPRSDRPLKIHLNIPQFDGAFRAVSERFISNNYGMMLDEEGENRTVIWSMRRADSLQSLYYRVTVGESHESSYKRGETYTPKSPFKSDLEKLAAKALIDPIRTRSADIETFVSETVKRLNELDNNNAQLLLKGDNSQENKALVATKLLTLAHIPVETVHALPLISGSNIVPETWIRSFNGNKWLYFNLINGAEGLPKNLLPWWTGNDSVAHVKGGKNLKVSFSASRHEINTLDLATMQSQSLLSKLSLYNLPVQTQQVYQILLTIPIGVLVILVLRTFVGIVTFGTFTPVLISLAFRETELLWGIILFTLVTALGLLVRSYLEHLRLLLLPRLGVVLSCVVLIMLAISLISHPLGLERGLSVALFPMVILTMTIERMSIMWEERGAGAAMTASIGSLFAASLAYITMSNERVVYLLFTFPGLVFVMMALMIVFGRYSGYKLSELFRFKAFWQGKQ